MHTGSTTLGTVTLLFTDIEGSTRLWEADPERMRVALAEHDNLMRGAIERFDGTVFKTIGDAFCAVFDRPVDAVRASLEAQLALRARNAHSEVPLKVRMAVHTGEVEFRDQDYFGPPLNRVARLLSTGHGGQILLSDATRNLVADSLPSGASLLDLGEHRLKDLGRPERVAQLVHADLAHDFAPLRSLSNSRVLHNLPLQLTSFIGRENVLEEVRERLDGARLLTLTGAGGSGKTRLSLQVAADQVDQFADGVWFVELAHLASGAEVPQGVATVLGVKEQAGVPLLGTLTDHLTGKSVLLVLDNCEHVVTAAAELVEPILRRCPNVKVLASTREAMGIAGEHLYRVPSLSVPDPARTFGPEDLLQFESVRLFIDRATLASPNFAVTTQNAKALASLCYHLDGIPLALELAAARVRSLSIEEIDGKLDQRFRLLTGGSRTALPRQQTLRALVGWSYDLLTEIEREAYEQLSAFSGGWTLAMAEKVCGDPIDEFDVLDLLTALVDKSLVNLEQGGNTRYSMYESLREFAREQLARRPEVEANLLERHAEAMARLGFDLSCQLRTRLESEALPRLRQETANLKAALAWARQNARGDLSSRIILALASADQRRGYSQEAISMLDEVLSPRNRDTVQGEILVRLLAERATLALDVLADQEALPFAQAARDAAEAENLPGLVIRGENLLGQVAMAGHDYAETRNHFNRGLALAEQTGDWIEMARMRNNLGIVERRDPSGDKALAAAHYEAALAIQRAHQHTRGEAETLNSLGVLEQSRGEYEKAASAYLQSARLEAESGHTFGVAKTLANYGEALVEWGRYEEAVRPLVAAEVLFAELRSPYESYAHDLVTKAAAESGTDPVELTQIRAVASRTDLKDAVAVSLQEG